MKLRATKHLGKVWVGCDHGQQHDGRPPLLCLDCLREFRALPEHRSPEIFQPGPKDRNRARASMLSRDPAPPPDAEGAG